MLYLTQRTTYPHSPKAMRFKVYEYLVVPLVNMQKHPSLICTCHEIHIVTLLRFLNIRSLALAHSTALMISTTLKNSCANDAAYGSKEKENWQDIRKTHEINNTVLSCALSQ